MSDGTDQPRSLESEHVSFIRFINRTQQTVDLFWIDYAGDRVKYSTLQPGGQFAIDTFATHPWIFRDAVSGYPLRAEGQEVFYPRPWNPEHNKQCEDIYIDLSVYTLKNMCIEMVRRCYSVDRLKKISTAIPADLLLELMYTDSASPAYQVSQHYQI